MLTFTDFVRLHLAASNFSDYQSYFDEVAASVPPFGLAEIEEINVGAVDKLLSLIWQLRSDISVPAVCRLLGRSQTELARLLDVPKQTMSAWMNGIRSAPVATQKYIAYITITELMANG